MSPPMKLKIFQFEQTADVVVVTPAGEGSAFRYQDLHVEVNAIRSHMIKPGQKHLVVDLMNMDYFGSEFIGSLVSMLREVKMRRGMACFCCAKPQMIQVLNNMGLFKLWPNFDTREAALEAVKNHAVA
jgi:anti-anti-sigma factor